MSHGSQRPSRTRPIALLLALAVAAGGAVGVVRWRATSGGAAPASPSAASRSSRTRSSPARYDATAATRASGHADSTQLTEQMVVVRSASDAAERRAAVDALSTTRPEQAGPARTQEIVELLDDVSHGDPQPRVRERAVFALADVAGPESASRLRELALSDTDPNVRSAALASLRLLQDRNPEPPKGDLVIQARGPARVGGIVTVKATMVSRVDVAQARLVMTIPPTLEVVSGTPGWEGALSADQPQSIDLALRARDAGVFPLFSSLRLTWSPLEFESTDRFITLSTETGEIRVEASNRQPH